MWPHRLFTLIASALLTLGIFMPFLGVRYFKDQSYWQLSKTGAIVLIALAAISIIIAALRKFKWLYLTGIAAVGLLFYSINEVNNRKAGMLADVTHSLEGSPLKGIGVGFVESVDYRYGWAVMLTGAVILILVPLIGSRLMRRQNSAQ
jgi:hypothetical protein